MLTAARLRLGGVRTLRHALMMINNFRYLDIRKPSFKIFIGII